MTAPPEAVTTLVQSESLGFFCRQLLKALAVPEPHARVVVDSLVAANLRGVDSHGVQMLPIYIRHLQAGGFKVHEMGRVLMEDGVLLKFDGKNGFGQVVADQCTDHSIRICRALGVSVVVAQNSNHFGAGAWWGEKIARAGFIGIAMSNAGPAVAPWQGKSPVFGTNPLCVAVPGNHGNCSWLLDMATTTVALGKLAHAANLNQATIPLAWGFLDASGRPTTDTVAAQGGAPTPTGGYKGSALAMMVEILCSGLSGGNMATEVPGRTAGEPLGISHTFIAIDPARFMPAGEFAARMDRLVDIVKAATLADGHEEILVAGEPEWRCQETRQRQGIPVPQKLWAELNSLAQKLKVSAP